MLQWMTLYMSSPQRAEVGLSSNVLVIIFFFSLYSTMTCFMLVLDCVFYTVILDSHLMLFLLEQVY